MLGKLLLILSCPESVRLQKEFSPRLNAAFSTLEVQLTWCPYLDSRKEKSDEQSRRQYVVCTDLNKAFGILSRSDLYTMSKLLGCPETLLS